MLRLASNGGALKETKSLRENTSLNEVSFVTLNPRLGKVPTHL